MGFLKRLFGRDDEAQANSSTVLVSAPEPPRASQGPRVEISYSFGGEEDLVKLTGTTTFAREAVMRLAERHGIDVGGYLETAGTLQREPDNPADPMAVAVHVEGEKIGYLPGYLARYVDLSADGARTAQVQIFTEMLPKGLRAEAWVWLAEGEPEWQWTEFNRPALSPGAKVAEHQAGIDKMVADALAGGGSRAQSFAGGMVNGVHYLQLVEPIKQLKREGRLEDALVLCTAAIQGAEAAREGREPAPWYTEQAAIIYRKLGRRDDEIAVLSRWLAACPPERRGGSRIKERFEKLT
ncbi:HIRAN domain-containing protein [Microbacterium sp. ASV81]|uniref:HIRAN domain-containing protein n=1 Tax=Microbacterium capsulatum TaxID=3041921 RepID=A0ABU0XBU0_9MICO|nr:HIRAN domain-containing protein [Microbacterium sp. ASV81]MDQ4212533.1 hypothetical protein [Microbacterium sp. ASV81]